MKLLAFLDTTDCDAFARELAEEFAHNFPPAAAADPGAERKLAHAIEVLGNRAAKFGGVRPLGWYRKSKFMDAIKQELLGRGHAAEVADQVVYAAVLRLARQRGVK